MEYRKFENKYVVRLDVGDEIIESIKKLSKKENIKLASVSAIGATNEFIVGSYNVKKKEYHKIEYKGEWEILALTGNINTKNGEHYSHFHLVAGGEDGHCVGGHLNKAVISATCEMFITVIDGSVDRKIDDNIGLNIWKF